MLDHRFADGEELAPLADAQLEADRLAARELAHLREELAAAPIGVVNARVRRRREHVLPIGTPRICAISGGHLARGQNAAVPGLRALRELELGHLHLLALRVLGEALGIEVAVERARQQK